VTQHTPFRPVLLAVLFLLGVACSEPAPSSTAAAPRVASDAPAAPFDVAEVVRRARFPSGQGGGGSIALPTMLAPTVSPEFSLDTPVTDPGGGGQSAPAIASNGTDYLVVWSDDRGGDVDIHGARVSAAGTLLDGTSFLIARAINAQQDAAVAFDGTNYLVVWSDGRRGSGTDIYGARVTPAGVVLDPNGLPLSTSTVFTLLMSAPAIAFDGVNHLVVWEEKIGFSATPNLQGLRVSPAGTPLGGVFTVSSALGTQSAVSLAFDGTNFLAAWQDDRTGQSDIYAARISPAGTVLDTSGIAVSTAAQSQIDPAVAFNGTNFLIVWEDYRNFAATGSDLFGARVSPAGAVLDAAGLGLIQEPLTQARPGLVRRGSEFVLAWQDGRTAATQLDIYTARISAAGTVLDPAGVAVTTAPSAQSSVAVASNGTASLVTWHDSRPLDIVGARVSATGSVLDPSGFTVSRAPNSETNAAVAFDGTNYLVVWQDDRGSGFDLYGIRVSGTGTVLDASAIVLAAATGHQRNPAVAFDGTNYLVVWEDTRTSFTPDIHGTRVSPAGAVLDPAGLTLCTRSNAQEHPALAFDGTNYLLVWDDSGTSSSRDIYGTRVSKAGAVLDPSFLGISTNASDQASPTLAFDGTNYLVVWSDWRNSGASDVFGARVSRAGVVLDTAGLSIAGGTDAQIDPAIAFDGTNYLVAWADFRTFPHSNLFARRVRPAGTLVDGTALTVSSAVGHQQAPSVAFNGTDFLVAWQDERSGTQIDLYAARVTSGGIVTDSDGFPLSTNPIDESQVALASGGAQGVLAVYQAADSSLGSPVQRLRARRIAPSANTPPVADAQSLTTDEDTAIALELTGSDPEDDSLTYAISDPPDHGTLSGAIPKLTYTPEANYSGPDSFAFTVSDGQATSAPATVSITITPQPDPPVADAQSVTTPEDTATAITLTGSDPDGDPLSFNVVSGPSRGALSGTAPNLTYTPAGDYAGADSFTFTVSDGTTTSAPATVSITVSPRNDTPVAASQTVTVAEDTPKAITLSGTDADGDPLTFNVSPPSQGTLSGTAPNLTYTPAAGYIGPDSFTFTVSDAASTSAPATISITVTPVNDAPVAAAQSLTTREDTPVAVTLSATDVEGDPLTFTIASPPARGTLSGTPPNLTYTPAANYNGPDSFTFTASDGQATSAPATVSITITPEPDAPVANAQSVTVVEDTPKTITLSGTEPDGEPLTFALASSPAHGTLSGTAPNLTYSPAAGYTGPDSFTFTVSDGTSTSPPATVSITVTPVNDRPSATAQSVTTAEDTPIVITLAGTDPDGDPLSFTVASPPARGTLSGTPPNLTYTPAANVSGPDSFTFTVSDGQVTSAPATVSITVTSVNDAPVATAQSLTTQEDRARTLTLAGTDAEGSALSFAVAAAPSHGTLSGTPPNLTYTPAQDYTGSDSFTFTASDGQATSAPATVSITVTPVNDGPVAQAQTLTVPAGSPSPIFLSAADVDGDDLTFSIVSHPDKGRLTGTPPDVVFTPPRGFEGTTRFTFSVGDGSAFSSAEVQLTVVKRSLTVSAAVDSRRPAAGQQVRFYANAVDEGGAPISLEWDFGDGQTSQEELPVHAFAAAGTYDVRLKATTATQEAITPLRIRVRSADPVLVNPGSPPRLIMGEEGATLAFSVGTGEPGLSYTWGFGDGSEGSSGSNTSHAWADDGRFTLNVSSSRPGSPSVSRTVVIHNAPPVPMPQDTVSAIVGREVTVQLAGSDAAAARDPLQWELVSGEGSLAPDGTFRWTPSQEGLATVITQVLDGDGGSARLAFQISASAGSGPEPEKPDEGGCGCGTSSGGAPGAFGLGMLLLALVVSSRRARG
jgi:hypothetical protein